MPVEGRTISMFCAAVVIAGVLAVSTRPRPSKRTGDGAEPRRRGSSERRSSRRSISTPAPEEPLAPAHRRTRVVPSNVTFNPPGEVWSLLKECDFGSDGQYPDAWYSPRELSRLKRKGPRWKHNLLKGDFTEEEYNRHRSSGVNKGRLVGVGPPHVFIDQLFGGKPGFFIESGAHDGCRESHTLWLERWRGWRGLLVEPNPGLFKRLSRLQRRSFSANCCVATAPHPQRVSFSLYGALGGISDFVDKNKVAAVRKTSGHESADVDSGTDIVTTCVPIRDLLADCGRTVADLWVLDTEGAEVAVLKAAQANGGIPARVLYVEHSNKPAQRRGIYDVMKAAGWHRFLAEPLDDWYVSPDACAALGKCFDVEPLT
eukprot:Hpha_TRINITY_DN18569_c0_g1::TRINITY_DN18569_c0_g1_i1::g.195104::m.195104